MPWAARRRGGVEDQPTHQERSADPDSADVLGGTLMNALDLILNEFGQADALRE